MRHLGLDELGPVPLSIIASILVALLLLAIRMFVLVRLRGQHQRENRQETERLRFLVMAYRSMAGSFTPATGDHRMQMEEALADVVLFGSLRQVELASACAQALTRGEPVDYQPLIEELRADLRTQLGLEPIEQDLQIPHAGPGSSRGARVNRGDGEGGRGGGGAGRARQA
ncbi:MAG TPA: preprotein translocase subunit YajC [Ideonella sp.]|nr:preprotein translocase subunit YajC [Ideonella sp.]